MVILGQNFLLMVLPGTYTTVDVDKRFLAQHLLPRVDGSDGDHPSSLDIVYGLDGDPGALSLVLGPVCLLALVAAVEDSHADA